MVFVLFCFVVIFWYFVYLFWGGGQSENEAQTQACKGNYFAKVSLQTLEFTLIIFILMRAYVFIYMYLYGGLHMCAWAFVVMYSHVEV